MEASYSAQWDDLFSRPALDGRQRLPKPSKAAQAQEPGAKTIPLSDVPAKPKLANWRKRDPWSLVDVVTTGSIVGLHLLCLAAPFTFSWQQAALCAVLFFAIGCLGIDVSFHRQLTHRSFATPKWLEYLLAYLGTLGLEIDPIDWVRHHRFHHQNTDAALDPHSPYEGFFWAHCGWLMHSRVLDARAGENWIVSDLVSDPCYRFLHTTYPVHAALQYVLLFWLGGFPAVVWGGAVRQVLMWHVTWLVNSACHVWGSRPYATGDLSTNLGWLAVPTFCESWHNNHHAFPHSARHGLERWQAAGLAHDIRLPSEAQKRKLAASASANVATNGAEGKSSAHTPDSISAHVRAVDAKEE